MTQFDLGDFSRKDSRAHIHKDKFVEINKMILKVEKRKMKSNDTFARDYKHTKCENESLGFICDFFGTLSPLRKCYLAP